MREHDVIIEFGFIFENSSYKCIDFLKNFITKTEVYTLYFNINFLEWHFPDFRAEITEMCM